MIILEDTDITCVTSLIKSPSDTWRNLSKASGIPEKTYARRIKKLMESNLLRVVGECDPLMIKKGVVAHVWISCALGQANYVAQKIASLQDSRLVVTLSGAYALMAEFYFDDLDAMTHMIDIVLPGFSGIRHFEVALVLQPYKRASDTSDVTMLPESERFELSDTDRELIKLLMIDGRASLTYLSEALNSSEATIFRNIQSLTEQQILRFRVDIEPRLLNYGSEALICLKVAPNHIKTVASMLKSCKNTRCLFGTSGDTQLFWHVLSKDYLGLWQLINNDLGQLPGIHQFSVNMVNTAFKRCGAIRHITT